MNTLTNARKGNKEPDTQFVVVEKNLCVQKCLIICRKEISEEQRNKNMSCSCSTETQYNNGCYNHGWYCTRPRHWVSIVLQQHDTNMSWYCTTTKQYNRVWYFTTTTKYYYWLVLKCPLLTALFFSLSLFSPPGYFSPRRGYHRVLKFCMGI